MVISMATLISIINFCLYCFIVMWALGYLMMVTGVIRKYYKRSFELDPFSHDAIASHKTPTEFSINVAAVLIVISVGICIYQWTPFDPLAYGLFAVTFAQFFVTPILARWYYSYMAVSIKA